jgi:hypothetical protein
MIAVAVLAGLLGAAAGLERRAETFKHLAAYHEQAHAVLIDLAGGPLLCGTGLTEDDFESIFCGRGPEECRAYKAAMYHCDLAEKYRAAAKHPWLLASSDPEPPPGAFPEFEPDPLYYDLANDADDDGGLGSEERSK